VGDAGTALAWDKIDAEAAAATATIAARRVTIEPQWFSMTIDWPFVLALRRGPSGALLRRAIVRPAPGAGRGG
jgi:hypothetical protein